MANFAVSICVIGFTVPWIPSRVDMCASQVFIIIYCYIVPLWYGKCQCWIEYWTLFVFQLSGATSLLDQAQQPYNYLIESIRSRDKQIQKHKSHIATVEEDIR